MMNPPKIFWYAISTSILWAMIFISYLAYRAQEINFEIVNTKITLSRAATDIETEYEKLKQEKADLQAQLNTLNTLLSTKPTVTKEDIYRARPTTRPAYHDPILDKKIQNMRDINSQMKK